LSFPSISYNPQESEVKDEDHLKDLNLRQIGKLKETHRQAVKTAADLEERNSELQNHLFRRKDEIDALKASYRLNQTEYNNWQVVLKQKEVSLLSFCFYSLLVIVLLMRFLG
jgi:predicted RNase H-like nuclease (RuvC/YqgF family)